ncbi:MAG: nucleoside hydrolase [Oscillospiraceae bacterium]
MDTKVKMIIDVDTGVDDALAIIYALKNPRVQVLGIVSGRGNVDAKKATDNTLRVIELVNPSYEIPVVIGSDITLEGECRKVSSHVHGENGIGDAILPEPKGKPLAVDFRDFIYNIVKENTGEVVIVTLGHMTNLAMALEKYPDLPSLVKKVVVMGGVVNGEGNVLPYSEANIYGDPLAADRVFMADFKTTVVPLNVTSKTLMSKKDIEQLIETCKPENRPIADFIKNSFIFYMKFYNWAMGLVDCCPIHDPLAMLVAVNPQFVKTQSLPLRVETKGELTRGMFVCDTRIHRIDCKEIEIAMDVDSKDAVEEILGIIK